MAAPTSLLDILSQLRAKRKVAADEVTRIEADIKAVERTIELNRTQGPTAVKTSTFP